MHRNHLFVFILCVAYSFVNAQKHIEVLDSLLNLNIDIPSKKAYLENYLSNSDFQDDPEIFYKLSIYFYRQGAYAEAIKYGKQTLISRSKESPLDSLQFRKSISNLSLFAYQHQNFNLAEHYCKQLLQHKRKDKYTGRAYYRLGIIYEDSGDYYRAIEFYKNSVKYYKAFATPKDVINSSLNIARTYTSLGDKESIQNARLTLDLLQLTYKESLQQKDKQDLFLLYGNIYNHDTLEEKEKSLDNYFKALEIAQKRNDEYYLTALQNNIGNIYLKHDLEKAKNYLAEGMRNAKTHKSEAMFLHNLGIYYFKTENYSKAVTHLKYSIVRYLGLDKKTPMNTITSEEFQASVDKSLVLDAFIFLIEYQNHFFSTKKEGITKVYDYIDIAEKLVEFIRFESDDQQSKFYWQEQAAKLYQQATKTAFLSNDPEKAFYFMEKNKAILLLEDITDRELKENANLPETIISKEQKLKERIYALQDLYSGKNELTKDSIVDIMNTTKIRYSGFIDSLKTDHPTYYNYKKSIKVQSLQEVQSLLRENQVVIEYILNQEDGHGLLISKSHIDLFELNNVSQLNKDITTFKSKIATPFIAKSDFTEYNDLAYKLYQKLFPFENVEKHLYNKKITIVPDYSLQNFPFEALVTEPNTKKNIAYLITEAEINYTYSVSFLKENQIITRDHTTDFVGFAPVQFDYDQLPKLNKSEKEIEQAENRFSGSLYLNDKATKDSFINNTLESKIIHLSTHANATDSITPWIAFRDKKLTLNELYTTKNNAELVVLSACNSSRGELKPGEGVMSLSRGFFYAGANSVISSIWNVDDKSGQYITTYFYKQLKKGKTKSESLRQAKLNYLRNHSLSETSPYYWSSLILIGDPGSIDFPSQHWIWWGIVILVVMSVVFMIRLKK